MAQYNLGVLYTLGEGVPVSYIKAYLWISLSAAQGYKMAQSDKSILAKMMTSEQITKAKELSSICITSNYKNCDKVISQSKKSN